MVRHIDLLQDHGHGQGTSSPAHHVARSPGRTARGHPLPGARSTRAVLAASRTQRRGVAGDDGCVAATRRIDHRRRRQLGVDRPRDPLRRAGRLPRRDLLRRRGGASSPPVDVTCAGNTRGSVDRARRHRRGGHARRVLAGLHARRRCQRPRRNRVAVAPVGRHRAEGVDRRRIRARRRRCLGAHVDPGDDHRSRRSRRRAAPRVDPTDRDPVGGRGPRPDRRRVGGPRLRSRHCSPGWG